MIATMINCGLEMVLQNRHDCDINLLLPGAYITAKKQNSNGVHE